MGRLAPLPELHLIAHVVLYNPSQLIDLLTYITHTMAYTYHDTSSQSDLESVPFISEEKTQRSHGSILSRVAFAARGVKRDVVVAVLASVITALAIRSYDQFFAVKTGSCEDMQYGSAFRVRHLICGCPPLLTGDRRLTNSYDRQVISYRDISRIQLQLESVHSTSFRRRCRRKMGCSRSRL